MVAAGIFNAYCRPNVRVFVLMASVTAFVFLLVSKSLIRGRRRPSLPIETCSFGITESFQRADKLLSTLTFPRRVTNVSGVFNYDMSARMPIQLLNAICQRERESYLLHFWAVLLLIKA